MMMMKRFLLSIFKFLSIFKIPIYQFAINFKIPDHNNFKIQMQFPVKDLEPTEDGDQTSEVNQQVEPPEDEDYFYGTFAPADSADSSVLTL